MITHAKGNGWIWTGMSTAFMATWEKNFFGTEWCHDSSRRGPLSFLSLPNSTSWLTLWISFPSHPGILMPLLLSDLMTYDQHVTFIKNWHLWCISWSFRRTSASPKQLPTSLVLEQEAELWKKVLPSKEKILHNCLSVLPEQRWSSQWLEDGADVEGSAVISSDLSYILES